MSISEGLVSKNSFSAKVHVTLITAIATVVLMAMFAAPAEAQTTASIVPYSEQPCPTDGSTRTRTGYCGLAVTLSSGQRIVISVLRSDGNWYDIKSTSSGTGEDKRYTGHKDTLHDGGEWPSILIAEVYERDGAGSHDEEVWLWQSKGNRYAGTANAYKAVRVRVLDGTTVVASHTVNSWNHVRPTRTYHGVTIDENTPGNQALVFVPQTEPAAPESITAEQWKAKRGPERVERRTSEITAGNPDGVVLPAEELEAMEKLDEFAMNGICVDGDRIWDPMGGRC